MSQMSSSNKGPIDPDVLDQMIQQATCGLNDDELRQLDALELADEQERIELTAAAFDLAMLGNEEFNSPDDDLPASLRQKIAQDAQGFLKNQSQPESQSAGRAGAIESAISPDDETQPSPTVNRVSAKRGTDLVTRREIIAMSIAAASLLLVFTGLNPLTYNPNKKAPVADNVLGPAEQLTAFLSNKPSDFIELPWKGVMDKGVEGRVVWSDSQQRGFMVLRGLPVNDPKVEQYQLWIFDTDPAQEIPVDGGVFDIAKAEQDQESGEVIIPFKPHVPVDKGVMFAITIERPGGVMKSDRSRLPVLASIN